MTGVGIETFKRRMPELASKYDAATGQVSASSSVHSAKSSWIDSAWNLLYLAETSSDSVLLLAIKLGKETRECAGLIVRAHKLRELCQSRGRKAARFAMDFRSSPQAKQQTRIAYPRRPHASVSEVVRRWEGVLPELMEVDPKSVATLLRYYVNHAWSSEAFLIFHDPSAPKDAICYLKFLNSLGFPKNSLRFIFFNSSARSSARRKWSKSLGLTWRHRHLVEFRKPPFRSSAASKRWLAIEPKFESDQSKNRKAFRFLMLMAAIAFGYDPNRFT